MKKFIYLIIFSNILNTSTNIEKSWLENKPRSYAKDFYISLYLKQDITSDDAIWALGQAKKVNNKLLYPYSKALNNADTSNVIKCMKMYTKDLYDKKPDCIKLGLKLHKATRLSKEKLKAIIDKIKPKYNDFSYSLEIINAKIPFIKLINSSDKQFFAIFNNIGIKFRSDNFNHHIPLKKINSLSKYNYSFAKVVKKIVTNPNLYKIQESLFRVNAEYLNHKTQFFLAINAIKHTQNKIANNFLKLAFETAYYKFDKDKVLYWQYQLNKSNNILKKLSRSWSNNIYSIYAKEKLGVQITNIKTNNNVFFKKFTNYDYNNPFAWLKVLKDIKIVDNLKKEKYEKLFNTKETQGHISFVYEKYFGYKKTYLPNPFDDLIKDYPIKRQILINAIAKQESRFIPTSISTAYALGVMQIMPFLSKDIAKQLEEPYDIFKQLEAPTNLKYANFHLNFLERRLNHILFVAYAYNGGIGFTNRKILKNGLFKNNRYDPYLSMELIPYDESKKYGKKVLVNYLLYTNMMNPSKKLTLKKLTSSIKNPY